MHDLCGASSRSPHRLQSSLGHCGHAVVPLSLARRAFGLDDRHSALHLMLASPHTEMLLPFTSAISCGPCDVTSP